MLAKLKHSIYETENDVIIWIADVAVATGCGGYSSFLACLLEHSVEFSYRCRDYDGRWCCTQAVHYLLLARYCYKLYIFIFKWISYEMRERDYMKFSRLLSIGNLSSISKIRCFCRNANNEKGIWCTRWWYRHTTHKYQPNGKMLCVHCLATSIGWCSKVNFMDLFQHNEYGDLHMANAIWMLKIVGTLSNKYNEGNRNWKRLAIWAIKWH